MSIDGLALQELRETCEEVSDGIAGGAWIDHRDARLILALMDERDAALDAEGVGVPWVSVEERRPTLADADGNGRVLWGGPGTPTICAVFQLEMSAYTHWSSIAAIPLPSQSGASAGLREAAVSMRACADGEDALAAQLTARARIMRRAADEVDAALRADEDPVVDARRLIAEVDAQCDEIEQILRADEGQADRIGKAVQEARAALPRMDPRVWGKPAGADEEGGHGQ